MSARGLFACIMTCCMLACAACGAQDERTLPGQQQGVAEVLASQTQGSKRDGADQNAASDGPGTFSGDGSDAYGEDDVDVDLTAMGADMVYATVADMMANPGAYAGKVVRMEGPFAHSFYEETGAHYFFVIIRDATACCAQGLEFVCAGTHAWPDDYPAEGEELVVTGVLEVYEEDGSRYAHLVDASVCAA